MKSQTARASGGSVGLDNQLNTIRLNWAPTRGIGGKPYKSSPARGGKRVLVVDDICTEGNSFEAARAYLRAAGAHTVCVSWLKTINTDYRAVAPAFAPFDPYVARTFPATISTANHWYSNAIRSHAAPTDLADVYMRYFCWDWPNGIRCVGGEA